MGEYDAITGVLDLSRGSSLFWHGNSPPKDRTLHIIEQSTVNITIYALLASTASCGIVMAAVFLAINIRYRNQRYVTLRCFSLRVIRRCPLRAMNKSFFQFLLVDRFDYQFFFKFTEKFKFLFFSDVIYSEKNFVKSLIFNF